jgi:hypothetical protein
MMKLVTPRPPACGFGAVSSGVEPSPQVGPEANIIRRSLT